MSRNDHKENGNTSLNRAKPYQLVLFPFNNGATNVYYILTATYIAYYGNGVLGLALMFATTMVTVMRLFDAVTDPIIGALIDKTNGRFGKFRPYMILGNIVMAVSAFLLYFATRWILDSGEHDVSSLHRVRRHLYGLRDRLYLPDIGDKIRTDGADKRSAAAAAVYDIQSDRQHDRHGFHPVLRADYPREIR